MEYVKVKDLKKRLEGKGYSSISCTGSVRGMKKQYGWDKAQEIFRSGKFIYAIWG